MLTANFSSVPEIKTPSRTLVIFSIITLGIAYLYWKHIKMTKNEEDSAL